MAYTLPTASQFFARFPEFVDQIDDTEFTALLEYAKLWVDPETWAEQDYAPALIYLVAHYARLSLLAIATNQANAGAAGGVGGITETPLQTFLSTVTIGDRTVSWRAAPKSAVNVGSGGGSDVISADEFLRRSYYGQLFLQLRRRNIFPIAVI